MKQRMEYHIISGHVIETRRCYMSGRKDGKKRRGTRIAGSTSEKKIQHNEREAVKRLARTLNCNFFEGLFFVTLKYSNDRLPASYEEAQQRAEKFMRQLRREHKKLTGEALSYVLVTANRSPKRKAPARLHHHIVFKPISLDIISQCWPSGEFHVRRMGMQKDLTALAVYMLDNVELNEPGKKKYSTSHGLEKPCYTEPVPVDEIDDIRPMPNTSVIEAEPTYNEDGLVVGAYMRSFAYEKPRVRGTMVILPKKKQGGRKKYGGGDIAEIWKEDI